MLIPTLDILSDIQHYRILSHLPISIPTDIYYCILSYPIRATSSVTVQTHILGTRPQTEMRVIRERTKTSRYRITPSTVAFRCAVY